MPPKKRTTNRKTAEPTISSEMIFLRGNACFNQLFESTSAEADNFFGSCLTEAMQKLSFILEEQATDFVTADALRTTVFGNTEVEIAEMITRRAAGPLGIVSSEVNEVSAVSKAFSPMKIVPKTPNAKVLHDDFEDVELPKTLRRMEQLSISRRLEAPSSASRSIHPATPRRNPLRQPTAQPATPRAVFSTTPGRNPIRQATAQPTTPRIICPTTPSRAGPSRAPVVVENKQCEKMDHADNLRNKILERKREKAREDEARRLAVQERRKEQERLQKEKNEALRKKEEERANFLRQQRELKSPTRAKVAPKPAVRTPSKNLKPVRKVLVPTDNAPTPGRVAAKRGRVEVFADTNSPQTVAQPTCQISPSRNLPRSGGRREPTHEPMDIDDPTPHVKPKARAKRSQTSSSAAAQSAASLQAAQEQYLMQQAAEAKARAEEKRLAREAEAARRHEEERLRQIQEEEEERLRRQREREEAELKATLERQAEKKAKGRTPPPPVYQMTPPRTYKAASKNDYGLNDLNSDDETDQEDEPRKEVPEWAAFPVVRESVRRHMIEPPFDVSSFFGEIEKPVLKTIFGESVRAKKRGSSAVWKKSPAPGKNRAPLQSWREKN